uniref:Uncharacterized protein n=1 Tax=Oryza barthii TaxID=65489 RepID=A0A0D3GH93_9ORYZ
MGQAHTIWDGLGRSIEMDREGGLRTSTGDGGYGHEGVRDAMHGDSKKSRRRGRAACHCHRPRPYHQAPTDRERVTELASCFRGATSSAGLLDTLHELRDVADESERNMKLLMDVPGMVEYWSD